MRKILNVSQLFGCKTYIDSEQLANITCDLVSVYLAYFTGSAESHCATLDRNTYITILNPGICLIFTFC